jgi:hypothetical protein
VIINHVICNVKLVQVHVACLPSLIVAPKPADWLFQCKIDARVTLQVPNIVTNVDPTRHARQSNDDERTPPS